MKLLIRTLLAGLIILAVGFSNAPPSRANPTAQASSWGELTQLIEGNIGNNGYQLEGAALLVIRNGQPVYEQYFGTYGLTTTVFIASASKWMAGGLIATLVQSGTLTLDTTAASLIPSFNTPEKNTITLRQLMSHTSGLPFNDADCISNRFTTMAACVDQIAALPLIAPPGTAFAYGSNSMQVAGRMAEVASGKTWNQLVQSTLVQPLGLTATGYAVPNSPNQSVAGGLTSSLRDYGRFVQMLQQNGLWNGAPLLSPESVAAMHQNYAAGTISVFNPGQDAQGYGLGVWLDRVDVAGNPLQVSSPGVLGFTPWVNEACGFAAVFMVQDQRDRLKPLILEIQQSVPILLGCQHTVFLPLVLR